MKLIVPTMEYDRQIQDFRKEYLADGGSMDGGASLRKYENTQDWLDSLESDTSQFIYVREEDNKMVGIIQLRHRFNDYLRKYAGHIGYSVRPSERKKGYATQMLSLVLPVCEKLGIYDVLVTCLADNEASRRTILANGGVFESEILEPDMQAVIERYWIRLPKPREENAMLPDRETALRLLEESHAMNPGPWREHSLTAAHCAEAIAKHCGMDAEKAYILGLLHDIGRRCGVYHMRHVVDGYVFLLSLGYTEAARACLTHSFADGDLDMYIGKRDTTEQETALIEKELQRIEFDDYDRLIQLCDALAGAEGVMDIEDRMNDVRRRYGHYSQRKWDMNLSLKAYFEEKMGMNIYEATEKDTFRP